MEHKHGTFDLPRPRFIFATNILHYNVGVIDIFLCTDFFFERKKIIRSVKLIYLFCKEQHLGDPSCGGFNIGGITRGLSREGVILEIEFLETLCCVTSQKDTESWCILGFIFHSDTAWQIPD